MRPATVLSLLLMGLMCVPLVAQKPQQVDWEAKMLTWELQKLGDPGINMMLPELYRALAQDRAETGDSNEKAESGKRTLTPPRPTLMSLLKNPSVRREIEMLDSQFEEVETRAQDIQRQAGDQILALLMNADRGSVDRQLVRQKIQEIRANAAKELEELILPFQFERLKQVAYHVQMRQRRLGDVLTDDPLAAELGLSDEQKEKLRETAQEIEEELQREIAKLRARARQKLYAELRPDQQKKLERIVGDDFKYEEAPPVDKRTAGDRNSDKK